MRDMISHVPSKWASLWSFVVMCVIEACNGGMWAHDKVLFHLFEVHCCPQCGLLGVEDVNSFSCLLWQQMCKNSIIKWRCKMFHTIVLQSQILSIHLSPLHTLTAKLLLRYISGPRLLGVLLSFLHIAQTHLLQYHWDMLSHTLTQWKPLKSSHSPVELITERLYSACVHKCLCVSVCPYVCVCCFHSSVLIIGPGLSSFIRRAMKWRDGGADRGSGDGAEVVIGLFRSLGLAQGHCETNSGPGVSLFLPLSPFFSHHFLDSPPF